MKRDNIHYSFRSINGYPQPIKIVISPREPGKSTSAEIEIALANFKKGGITIYFKRQIADITSAYIESFERMNNKFDDVEKIHLSYNKGELKEGIVHVYNEVKTEDGSKKVLFIVIIALSLPQSRRKSLCYPNLKACVFDEFICDLQDGEKYLPGEFKRWEETYNTLQRECPRLPCYFLGNPYSLYNPYFIGLNVDTSKLYPGAIVQGGNYVIQCYQLTEELKAQILANNPLYEFDDSYRAYAFDGRAVQDENIQVSKILPPNFSLKFVFRIQGKFIGVFRGDLATNCLWWYCKFLDDISASRTAICFDFSELVNRCAMLSTTDRIRFSQFASGMRLRKVYFSTIECYYMIQEIYYNL